MVNVKQCQSKLANDSTEATSIKGIATIEAAKVAALVQIYSDPSLSGDILS